MIYIQHDGSRDGFCVPNTKEWEILSSLEIKASDIIMPKTANDSFYGTSLKDDLLKANISELVITGCATDFCVDSTVKSALVNDFNVRLIEDGHTTADRTNIKAKDVIDHYNWIWSEMIPTKGKIKVVDFKSYLENH